MPEGRSGGDSPAPESIAERLDACRRRIDALDEEIVRLLNARAAWADEIGRLKERVGMEVYQPGRERTVLDHVRRVNAGPLPDVAVIRLFERIIDESRRLERLRDAQEPGGGQAAGGATPGAGSEAGRRRPRSGGGQAAGGGVTPGAGECDPSTPPRRPASK